MGEAPQITDMWTMWRLHREGHRPRFGGESILDMTQQSDRVNADHHREEYRAMRAIAAAKMARLSWRQGSEGEAE